MPALKTKAECDGDHYVINAAKIWTSYAQFADWIFCLVRTSSEGKRQQGITFLLIDMKSEGIEVNPIVTIDNHHSLNEVAFTNVRVPVENRIGEENKGWTYAKALLAHERTGIANVADSRHNLDQLIEFAKQEVSGESTAMSGVKIGNSRRQLDWLQVVRLVGSDFHFRIPVLKLISQFSIQHGCSCL